jgi:hypothetical protein
MIHWILMFICIFLMILNLAQMSENLKNKDSIKMPLRGTIAAGIGALVQVFVLAA